MPIRILIADDHALLRAGLKALLSAQPDFEVVGEAGDGKQAVRLARELAPDIVLLDIGMPELDGIAATKQIHEQVRTSRVLILTLHEDEAMLRQALANGASGYIVKRAVETELTDAIRAVSEGLPYVHPAILQALLNEEARPHSSTKTGPDALSPRELEVLKLMAEGHTNRQIAEALHLSVRTVEGHRANLADKLNLTSPIQIVRYAMEHGLIK